MQKHFFFLLTFFCFLSGSLTAKAGHSEPSLGSEAFVTCTLTAPTNLQRTFPNPVQATYTWNGVSGAWGYRIVVTDLNSAGITVHTTTNTTITLNTIPGHTYNVKFYSMCSEAPGDYGSDYEEDEFMMPGIVIELIVEGPSCGSVDEPVTNASTAPGYFVKNGGWGLYEDYFIKMTNPGGGQTLLLKFKMKQVQVGNSQEIGFELLEIGNPAGCILDGISLTNAQYAQPPAITGNGRLTFDNKSFTITFSGDNEFGYSFTSDQNGNTFQKFGVYAVCSPYGMPPSHGDDGVGMHDASGVKPSSINPFSSNLIIFFIEVPTTPVKTRLLDLQGRSWIETAIQPDELTEGTYSIPTEDLPTGLYFLQMETQPGQFVTRKVMKI